MSDTVKIRCYIHTNKVGSECTDIVEIDREEWEDMDEGERDEYLQECAFQMMEWGYEEVE